MSELSKNTNPYVDQLRKGLSLIGEDECQRIQSQGEDTRLHKKQKYMPKGLSKTDMDDFLQQLDQIGLTNESDYWVILRAYSCSLSDEELLNFYISKYPNNVIIESVLQKRDANHLSELQHKTISKLLKKTKKYRHVADQKKKYSKLIGELLTRYKFASLKDRRRIIAFMFDGDKYERRYVYSNLYQQWDDYFFDRIISIYEQYHEGECLKIFIKHYPQCYLKDKFNALVDFYDYQYACYCMGAEQVAEIERDKMSPGEYIRLMATFKRQIPVQEAEDILYHTLVYNLFDFLCFPEQQKTSLLAIRPVKHVVVAMGGLGMKESLISFAKICSMANKILVNRFSSIIDYNAGKVFYEIMALLPQKYQTTDDNVDFDQVVKSRSYYLDSQDELPF